MGISGIPDILLPAELSEIGDEHDLAYLRGGTRKDKWQADKRLFKRLKDRRHWLSLVLFPPFVLTIGWLPWHWKYRERPMSEAEMMMRKKFSNYKENWEDE